MRLSKDSTSATLALLLLLSIGCVGCASWKTTKVVLHPIDKKDIIAIPKGSLIGDTPTESSGFFLSDLYLKEVLDAKVE